MLSVHSRLDGFLSKHLSISVYFSQADSTQHTSNTQANYGQSAVLCLLSSAHCSLYTCCGVYAVEKVNIVNIVGTTDSAHS